jgi:hypothetical protein
MQGETGRVTLLVTRALEKINIPYAVSGEVSDRQWRDILGVLKTREGELDLDYMRKWAGELKVGDLLERALADAG